MKLYRFVILNPLCMNMLIILFTFSLKIHKITVS